jgi:hypothetical protein
MKPLIVLLAVASFMVEAAATGNDRKSISINRQFATAVTVKPDLTTPARSRSASTLTLDRVSKPAEKSVQIKKTRRSLVQWLRGDSVATPTQKLEQTLQSRSVLRPANKASASQFSTQRAWKARRP